MNSVPFTAEILLCAPYPSFLLHSCSEAVLATLKQTHELIESYKIRGFHKNLQGRNGGGDPWHTDGNLAVGVIATHYGVFTPSLEIIYSRNHMIHTD